MSYFDYQVTARYIQCPHALQELKRYTFGLGKRFLVLTACGPITEEVMEIIRESFANPMETSLMKELAEKNPRYNRQISEAKRFDAMNLLSASLEFMNMEGKEVTEKTIQSLALLAKEKDIDVVIGVGGGKALDFARGVSYYTNIKCVLVPTSAATNAAATQLCVVKEQQGESYLFLANYPSLVLADTSILIKSPASALAGGIADQIGSYYECLYSAKRLGIHNEHSNLCWDVVKSSLALLMKYGKEAVEAAKAQKISHAYETVLSLVLHNNGLARSVSGSGFAHLISKALLKFPQCRDAVPHGYQVGYGMIPMMIAEKEPKEKILEYLEFCREIGMPMNLEMLHLKEIGKEELQAAFDAVCQNPSAEVPFTGQEVMQSVEKAEILVKQYLEEKGL